MNRLIYSLGIGGILLIGRQILIYFIDGGDGSSGGSAAGRGVAASARNGVMSMIESLSGAKPTATDLSILSLGILVYSTFLGIFSDMLLGSRGFGRHANGAITLMGAVATLFGYSHFVSKGSADHISAMLVVTVIVSFVLLLGAAALKAFLLAEADSFMAGGETSVSKAVKSVKGSRQARGPSADRIEAALTKRK